MSESTQNIKSNQNMTEKEWVGGVLQKLQSNMRPHFRNIQIAEGKRLTFANEVLGYSSNVEPALRNEVMHESDILLLEMRDENFWIPRVVIDIKLGSISTQDALICNHKAQTHKMVHPFLRYGLLIGNRQLFPLPARLFRMAQHFDFMISWKGLESEDNELQKTINILRSEVAASRRLEEILFKEGTKNKKRITILHRPLLIG